MMHWPITVPSRRLLSRDFDHSNPFVFCKLIKLTSVGGKTDGAKFLFYCELHKAAKTLFVNVWSPKGMGMMGTEPVRGRGLVGSTE